MARELTEHAAAAKLIRRDLKMAFPTVAFAVRSRSYSGGDAVDVRWTDGPTSEQVSGIVGQYQEGHFDGMIDLYEYSNRRDDIPQVKYVQVHRRRSADALKAIAARIERDYGVPLTVIDSPYEAYIDRGRDRLPNGEYGSDLAWREFSRLSLVCDTCHAHTLPGDRFCPDCGTALADEAA